MTRPALAAGLGLLIFAAPAAAQLGTGLRYEFADAAGLTASSFTAQAGGGGVDVRVYLRLVADPNDNVADGGGLGSAGVRLGFDPAAGTSVAVTAGLAWSAAATDPQPGASVGLQTYSPDAAGVPLAVGDRVLLGTFRLTATDPGTVTLTADVFDPDNLTYTGSYGAPFHSYDGLTALANATLTVTPVPEPAGLLAAVLLAAAVARRRRTSLPG